jgi:hypothetical protein
MTASRILAAVSALAALALPHHAALADQQSLRGGSYEITARLELPHLERWAVDRTATVCLAGVRGNGEIPIPVLSANNPFAGCSAAKAETAANIRDAVTRLSLCGSWVYPKRNPRRAPPSLQFLLRFSNRYDRL